jgi:hypothetical protein
MNPRSLSSSLVSRAYEAYGRCTVMGTYNFAGDMGIVAFPAFKRLDSGAQLQGAVELLGAVGLAAALAVLLLLSLTAALVLLPVVGVFPTGTSSVLHAIVADLVAPEARARGYGLFYMLYQGLGIVAPVLYVWFSDATELTWAMILLGILTMAAASLAVLLREQTAIVTA